MQVRVRYFAEAKARRGLAEEVLEVEEGATLGELRARLPASVARFALAVNQEWAEDDSRRLAPGDEVAVLPPVSGGSASFLTEAPIDVAGILQSVLSPSCGAVVVFVGTVRNEFQGVPSLAVEYHAYPEMAERELQKLAEEVTESFPGTRLGLCHRLGRLRPTEASVVIAVAAPHRAEAFAACRHAIEELKRRVPIWKKEIRPEGEVWQSELTHGS